MAISRYKQTPTIKNTDQDYKKYFSSRFGKTGLVQKASTIMKHPTDDELADVSYVNNVWGMGQRLYKLAFEYYGDAQYWWVIALFNGIATESEIEFGQIIKVPVPIDKMLRLYGYQ